MRKFWDNTGEEENSKVKTRTVDGNLECEEQIITDIVRFGRVRTSLMRSLRENFGETTANKAMWRVRKRKTNGYPQEKNQLFQDNSLQDLAQLFLQSLSPDTSKENQSSSRV